MNRRLGPCLRATCTRRAKIEHACKLCDLKLRACQFHRDAALRDLQQHVMTEHAAEYKAARMAAEPVKPAAAVTPARATVVIPPLFTVGK